MLQILLLVVSLGSLFFLWRMLAELRIISQDTKKRDELGKSLDSLGDLIAARRSKKDDA